jgi:hypothetical protein
MLLENTMNEKKFTKTKPEEPAENQPVPRRWVKPTFERVPLKEAMSGSWDGAWSDTLYRDL